jgi:hypothetical protein
MKSIKLLSKRIKNRLSGFPSTLSLSNTQVLRAALHKFAWKLISVATNRVKVSPRLRRFNKFLDLLLKAYRHHGSRYVVAWLKSCHIAVQRKVSTNPMRTLRELERDLPLPRLINGLPSFIGTMDRASIRRRNHNTIRLWLTILSLYRVLDCPGKLKLESITNKSNSDPAKEKLLISQIKDIIVFNKLHRPIKNLACSEVHRTLASGPNCPIAISAVLTDAIAMAKYPEIYDEFKAYCVETRSRVLLQLNSAIEWCYHKLEIKDKIPWVKTSCSVRTFDDIALGKLAFKFEAAGKIRVFAIVDIWTQSLFKPLHNDLFDLLRSLPNDGTFDQDKAYARCLKKAAEYGCAYAADLSSATDRLPITIQEAIINLIYGSTTLGGYWRKILTLRPYFIRSNQFPDLTGSHYYYATGQPMGCLSSWAMLAITHHLIVQAAAFRVYGTRIWFDKYEVLGDDIVIFDKFVYLAYFDIMKELDVGINLSKSLLSDDLQTVEFAKRTGVDGTDVSGLSWKQLISEDSFMGRVNFTLSMLRKGLISSPHMIVRSMVDNSNINISHVFKDDSLRKLVEHGVMGILGSYSESGIIPLESVVALVADPQDEDMEFLDNPKVPLATALRLVAKVASEGSDVDLASTISSYEERVDLVKEEKMLGHLADSILRESLAKAILFANSYDEKVDNYARTLVAKDCYNAFDKVEQAQLRSFAEMVLLKDRDPQDLVDQVHDFSYNLKGSLPKLSDALKFDEKVSNFVSYLDIDPVKKTAGKADMPFVLKEIIHSGKIYGTPYWKLLDKVSP